jgi:hypothetical protein
VTTNTAFITLSPADAANIIDADEATQTLSFPATSAGPRRASDYDLDVDPPATIAARSGSHAPPSAIVITDITASGPSQPFASASATAMTTRPSTNASPASPEIASRERDGSNSTLSKSSGRSRARKRPTSQYVTIKNPKPRFLSPNMRCLGMNCFPYVAKREPNATWAKFREFLPTPSQQEAFAAARSITTLFQRVKRIGTKHSRLCQYLDIIRCKRGTVCLYLTIAIRFLLIDSWLPAVLCRPNDRRDRALLKISQGCPS